VGFQRSRQVGPWPHGIGTESIPGAPAACAGIQNAIHSYARTRWSIAPHNIFDNPQKFDMANSSVLFSPISLGSLTLPNRIMISPMCQYSARDGNANEWHMAHLNSLALSGAGLLCLEATAVVPEGRITPGCLGLYNDDNEAALKAVIRNIRAVSPIPLAIQLGHAGRKASSHAPWDGGQLITDPAQGGWTTVAPSAIPQKPEEPAPKAMTREDIEQVIAAFADSAHRAKRLGFDAIELHVAHGYLMHQFLSPLANQRDDEFGGSLENRMRFPLAVFKAVSDAVEGSIPVGVRLSATDWIDGGWDVEQSIVLSQRLEALGCAFLDVSSGGLSYQQKITLAPGYQVPFAEQIKRAVKIPVMSVGLITQPQQAEDIVSSGKADIVALARGMLNDPHWPWRAAEALGGKVTAPRQYWRCLPHGTPQIFGDVKVGQR
jgi:2,4-dienoyl-CoA reductase-like NADH-dependent reductase (Old Yellow Enzyme family)